MPVYTDERTINIHKSLTDESYKNKIQSFALSFLVA